MSRQPKNGDQVRYVLSNGPQAGEARPATVVKVHTAETGVINLTVLLDDAGAEDLATSVAFDEGMRPNTWHWPE